jgi:hypothetical protein
MYFNLECQNEYIDKTLSSNPEYYFQQILENNGFIVSTCNKNKKISDDEMINLTETVVKNTDNEFNKFLNDEMTPANQYMAENYNTLNIKDMTNDELIKYKDVITDNHVLSHYFNFMKYCKDEDYIEERIEYLKKNTTASKVLLSVEHKIKLIKELEKENNMKILDVEFNNEKINLYFIFCNCNFVKNLKNFRNNYKVTKTNEISYTIQTYKIFQIAKLIFREN